MMRPTKDGDYFKCPVCHIRGRKWAIQQHINRDHAITIVPGWSGWGEDVITS